MLNTISKQVVRAWLIALIPASGYTIAFCYEAGYCSYFGIPFQVISLEITSVFIALLGLAVGLSLYSVIFWILDVVFLMHEIYYQQISSIALPWLILTFFIGIYCELAVYILWLSLSVSLFGLFTHLKKRFPSVLGRFEQAPAKTVTPQFPFIPLHHDAFRVLLGAIVLITASFDVGYNSAATQQGFFVTGDEFLARLYGDTAVRMRFLRSSQPGSSKAVFERSLIISKLGDKEVVRLTFEKVGPLRPTDSNGSRDQDNLAPWDPRRIFPKHPVSLGM